MTTNKENLWIIGGGETFENREKYLFFLENTFDINRKKSGDWKSWLADGLFDTHNITKIPMPDKMNADYDAWKIIFEKYLDEMDTNIEISLIGHSLGGIFLAKYLGENKFPRNIKTLHLVAPVWTHPDSELHNTANFSFHPMNISNIPPQCENIYIWGSEDDEIVDFNDFEKYSESLPMADFRTFTNRGHFLGSHFVELFLEILNRTSK